MRRKSREVSIFSMSALDLFASALGAFILIAVVMFPYFPNTGTSDQRDLDEALERLQVEEEESEASREVIREIREELERRLEEVREAARRRVDAARGEAEAARREADAARQRAADLQQELGEARDELQSVRFPHLDLVIALDVTNSMRNEIDGLKTELDGMAGVLARLAPSLAVGIVAFGDREWDRPLTSFPLEEISGSAAGLGRLADFVNTLEANMGLGAGTNDTRPEAFLAALRAAARMQWRPQAERRQVVVITDNPAYPEEVGAAVDEASSFRARGGGRSVSTVFVRTGANEPETAAFLARVATTGGGEAVQAGGSMTANLLLSLL